VIEQNWDGIERRHTDPWRTSVEERIERIETTVNCIKKARDEFNETYGDLLKETVEARARKAKLWAAAAEELVKKGVWAAFAFVVVAVAVAAKGWVKGL
jgi:hypothetical protein